MGWLRGKVRLPSRAGRMGRQLALLAIALQIIDVRAALAQAEPPVVTLAKPLVREIVEDDEFVGRFEAVDAVEIRARVGGYLEAVHFRDGTLVEQGDLLFTIDQRPYQTALAEAAARLDTAKASVTFAEAQLSRAEALARNGNVSAATLDERRREYLAAKGELDGAEAALERADLNLEYTEIRAPLSGRIDRRLLSAGNLIEPDETVLTTIVSLDPIDFYFDIDEHRFLAYARDARQRGGGSLQEGGSGLEVRVSVADSQQPPFTGHLDFAENRLDRETGTMRVRARFANPDLILQPGLFGRINVPGSLPYRGVMVPDEAIVADLDRRIVYVVDPGGLVSAVPVRPGPRIHGYRVIREGLTGEETIVVNGLMRARPGMVVNGETITLPPERTLAETLQ